MLLETMKHPEIRAYLEHKKSIIVPFGSTEQHGPHLPVNTDTIVAASIAEEAGEDRELWSRR
jgi:creatinine amidohydrolase